MSHLGQNPPGFTWSDSRQALVKTEDDDTWTIAEWRTYYDGLAPQGQHWNFWTESYEDIPAPLPSNPEPGTTLDTDSDDEDMPKEIGSLPEVFNGDTRKATAWSLQMEAYFLLNEEVYDQDKKKIILTLSRMMKGEAAKWAEGELKRATTDPSVFNSYNTFTAKFKATFYPKNIAETAMRRISTIRQTGSVTAYASLFHTILTNTGIEEENMKILFFCTGLKRELVPAILAFENIPTTIDDWLSKALDVEVRRTLLAPPAMGKAKDPYAMDIDRMEAGEDVDGEKSTRKTYLMPQERDRRHKLGLCFKCGKKGLAQDCPNHPTVSTTTRSANKTTARKMTTNHASNSDKEDDEYKEFLEWKTFKACQAKKPKKEESEDEDF